MPKHYDLVETHRFNLCSAYAVALEYGDYSHMYAAEINDFLNWMDADLPKHVPYTIECKTQNEFMAHDCVTGLYANCIEVIVYTHVFKTPEITEQLELL